MLLCWQTGSQQLRQPAAERAFTEENNRVDRTTAGLGLGAWEPLRGDRPTRNQYNNIFQLVCWDYRGSPGGDFKLNSCPGDVPSSVDDGM